MTIYCCKKCGRDEEDPIYFEGELYCEQCFFNDKIEDCVNSGGLE